MRAVTRHGTGDFRFGEVPDPTIEVPTDPIVPITTSTVRGAAWIPTALSTRREPVTGILAACREFNDRNPGWLKVTLHG